MSDIPNGKAITTSQGSQTHCPGCKMPFIYGHFRDGKFVKDGEPVIQDTSFTFWHERCWAERDE